MTIAPPQETVPPETDPDGVVRIGRTRIPLETVISAFDAGATPETFCEDFPSLELGDVYAVVTYALRHRDEVDRYVARRRALADEVRQEVEALPGNRHLRERLLARHRS